jgi:hypothetical protein
VRGTVSQMKRIHRSDQRYHRILTLVTAAGLVLLVAVPAAAAALKGHPCDAQPTIDHVRDWLVATLVRLSTFLLTIGVARSLLAAGNPAEARPARETLLYAAIGYTLALLVHLC